MKPVDYEGLDDSVCQNISAPGLQENGMCLKFVGIQFLCHMFWLPKNDMCLLPFVASMFHVAFRWQFVKNLCVPRVMSQLPEQ
jgi:hypothetical protein